MSLGEKIYTLRTQKNLSQGDLADALDVSRQSISKWETNGSVPELDKLIKLSEVFGVTLDELVLDKPPEKAPTEPVQQVIYVERTRPRSAQNTLGIILLCFAALVWLVVALLGDILAGLVLAVPLLACGLICLFVRKNAGLWCSWVIYCSADVFLRFASGVSWQFAVMSIAYRPEWTVQLIMAWVLLLSFAALVIVTVLRFRTATPEIFGKNAIAAAAAWVAYFLSWFLFMLPPSESAGHSQIILHSRVASVSGSIRSIVLAAAVVFTVRLIILLWKKVKKK